MMDLAEYQSSMINLITGSSSEELEQHLQLLSDTSDKEAQIRLAVYQNNYAHSLSEALKATYPITLRLIGEQLFTALAIQYVKSNPPTSASLLHYGEGFIIYVANDPACRELGYLADVANIEWAYLQCFHGADYDTINMNHLLAEDEENLPLVSFSWNPNCFLLSSDYPALSIWEINLEEEVEDYDLSEAEASRCLIYRDQELNVVPMQLHPIAFIFCEYLQQGLTLSEAWQSLQGQLDEPLPDEELYQLLTFLLQLPVFTGLTINRG